MVDVTGPTGPGIHWEPGDEDYPFAAMPGESALDYFGAGSTRPGMRGSSRTASATSTRRTSRTSSTTSPPTSTCCGRGSRPSGTGRPGGLRSRGWRSPVSRPPSTAAPDSARHAAAERGMKVLVLHGVNLDMFGKRDPAMYGTITLAEIDAALMALGAELGVDVETFQTNAEGAHVRADPRRARGRDRRPWSSTPAPGPTTATRSGTPWRSCRCRSSRSTCRTSTRGRRSAITRCSPGSRRARSPGSAWTATCWAPRCRVLSRDSRVGAGETRIHVLPAGGRRSLERALGIVERELVGDDPAGREPTRRRASATVSAKSLRVVVGQRALDA